MLSWKSTSPMRLSRHATQAISAHRGGARTPLDGIEDNVGGVSVLFGF
ncbi:MAG: hypothetical protein WCS87_15040 [Methylococcaceae bacterium]